MTFNELKLHLEQTRGLHFFEEKTNNVSNKLYLFTDSCVADNFKKVMKLLLTRVIFVFCPVKTDIRKFRVFFEIVEKSQKINSEAQTFLRVIYI